MNKTMTFLGSLLIATIATSCGTGSKDLAENTNDPLANSPIVGQYVQVGTDKVMACDQKLLADTVRIPLSFFTEEMELVKLDNRDEALVGQTGVTVSDNYILVYGSRQNPFKLFDRKGKFLTNIGAIGQGPGEYQMVYDAKLDEANNRIYILPWNASQLLVYDLQGNVLDPIPLCLRCPKAKFNVDLSGGKVSVVLLPFKGYPAVAWTQDLEGKRIDFIEPGHLEAPQDFSNEVTAGFNIPGVFDVNILCIMPTRVDSLYRYASDKNRLIPTFTLNFANTDKIPWHGYGEYPHHFVGNFSEPPVEVSPGSWTNGQTFHYIVDKETGKGSFFTLYNDYFGNLEIGYPSSAFFNGYYIRNIEPGNLMTDIENALKNQDITAEMRKKLTDLQASIDENDNNYVMIAQLKR
ncbi:6-bladed beta-propeller [Parabacteroides massiliensis]|uniref:6-bladed beta-propeller n=1 Tax=Parabacteroides massiliensis TaxID=1750560 RepID=UPI00096AB7A4|nr:6-bladed beta-propeller [Parabacteroides massiliensis]